MSGCVVLSWLVGPVPGCITLDCVVLSGPLLSFFELIPLPCTLFYRSLYCTVSHQCCPTLYCATLSRTLRYCSLLCSRVLDFVIAPKYHSWVSSFSTSSASVGVNWFTIYVACGIRTSSCYTVQVASHDGEKVPLTIAHRRGLGMNGGNRLLLHG